MRAFRIACCYVPSYFKHKCVFDRTEITEHDRFHSVSLQYGGQKPSLGVWPKFGILYREGFSLYIRPENIVIDSIPDHLEK